MNTGNYPSVQGDRGPRERAGQLVHCLVHRRREGCRGIAQGQDQGCAHRRILQGSFPIIFLNFGPFSKENVLKIDDFSSPSNIASD